MSTSPDQHLGFDRAIDDPLLARSLDLADGRALTYLRAGAAKQVLIKLAAADAIADDVVVWDPNFPRSH